MISPDLFNYRKSPKNYFVKSVAHSAAGLGLGVVIDRACSKLQSSLSLHPALMIIMQITIIIICLYIIEMYLSKDYKYAMEWQNITPGLLFTGLLFGTQQTLFTNINKLRTSSQWFCLSFLLPRLGRSVMIGNLKNDFIFVSNKGNKRLL